MDREITERTIPIVDHPRVQSGTSGRHLGGQMRLAGTSGGYTGNMRRAIYGGRLFRHPRPLEHSGSGLVRLARLRGGDLPADHRVDGVVLNSTSVARG